MEQTTTTAVAAKRPTFLTVLCILSFVGIALGLLNFKNYMDAKALADGSSDILSGMGEEAQAMANLGASLLGIDYGKIATGYLIVGCLNFVILAGVLMMWKQRKTGFYIYTLGQIATLGVMFGYIGGLAGGMMGIVTGIFAVAFIIMYGVNMKHMR
jgi:hypothetical protein